MESEALDEACHLSRIPAGYVGVGWAQWERLTNRNSDNDRRLVKSLLDGNYMIQGKRGAGKTAILSAIAVSLVARKKEPGIYLKFSEFPDLYYKRGEFADPQLSSSVYNRIRRGAFFMLDDFCPQEESPKLFIAAFNKYISMAVDGGVPVYIGTTFSNVSQIRDEFGDRVADTSDIYLEFKTI